MPSKFTLWYALFALAVVASLFLAYNPSKSVPGMERTEIRSAP